MIMPVRSSIGLVDSDLTFFVEISIISKHLEKYEIVKRGAPALRVICAGTRLAVYRALPSTKTIAKPARVGLRTPVVLNIEHLFSDDYMIEKCLTN